MIETDAIARVMKFDPLTAADRLTGRDHITDDGTMALGVLLAKGQIDEKARLFKATGDNYYETSFEQLLEISRSEGFSEVLRDQFAGTVREGESDKETCVVMWHPDGILLWAESWAGDRVNGASIAYAWRPTDELRDSGRGMS